MLAKEFQLPPIIHNLQLREGTPSPLANCIALCKIWSGQCDASVGPGVGGAVREELEIIFNKVITPSCFLVIRIFPSFFSADKIKTSAPNLRPAHPPRRPPVRRHLPPPPNLPHAVADVAVPDPARAPVPGPGPGPPRGRHGPHPPRGDGARRPRLARLGPRRGQAPLHVRPAPGALGLFRVPRTPGRAVRWWAGAGAHAWTRGQVSLERG